MKELDLLKKDWQKNGNSFEQISETEIYTMLHKKSSSIVMWILIISILEVVLWTTIGFLYNSDDQLKSMHHEEWIGYYGILNYINFGVILIFIYLFYKNYKAISTTVATEQLMRDILKTRRTVKQYVGYNLAMLGLSLILGFILAFSYSPEVKILMEKIAGHDKLIALTVLVIFMLTALIFGAFWLFYRLIYGTLLRRLNANYKELQKIDF